MKKIILFLLISLNVLAQPNYVNDYTSPTWSFKSFNFDATNNLFTGDATISTTLNNTIAGSNKSFSLNMWAKKLANSTTQMLFCRDKSTATSSRQILVFFSSDKIVVTLYTNSTNYIQYTSTNTFKDTRLWMNIVVTYDHTQSATSRIKVYVNGIQKAGTTTQTGNFTTVSSVTTPSVNIGGRTTAANYSKTKINQVALFDTCWQSNDITTLYNNRVPFDLRNTMSSNLTMFLSADLSSTFVTNWTWTDLVSGGVFTSSGMTLTDLVSDAPALKQIQLCAMDGQSNIDGRVDWLELETKYKDTLNWLQFFNGTGFEKANFTANNNQYGDKSNQFGVEFYLADSLNVATQKTIYMFKYSLGGTACTPLQTPSWCVPTPSYQPSGGSMYQQLMNNDLPDLLDWELNNGFTITDINLVWGQGEKDCQVLQESLDYGTNESNLFTAITSRLNDYFYITPTYYDWLLSVNQNSYRYIYKDNVNSGKITNSSATHKVINTDSCYTNNVDSAHYNKASLHILADSTFYKMKLDGF